MWEVVLENQQAYKLVLQEHWVQLFGKKIHKYSKTNGSYWSIGYITYDDDPLLSKFLGQDQSLENFFRDILGVS